MTSGLMQPDVRTRTETHRLLVEVFEETALVLGGLVAVHRVDDDFVWRFVKALDAVRRKAIRRISEQDPRDDNAADTTARLRPHPAIEDFLLKLRRT